MNTVETFSGYRIVQNEYGTYNVPTINCFCTPSVDSARRAIDSHIARTVTANTVARLMAEGKTEADAVAEVKQYMVWMEQICGIARTQGVN